MTDPQPTESTVTIASQAIELALTGKPDVKNKWGAGSIRPRFVTFAYRQEGIHAHLYGVWVREDGELTDAPVDQAYRIGDTDEWPDWLADLAREHKPADRAAVLREAADTVFALDFDELRATSQFDSHRQAWELGTIDASTALRRMADETPQPETDATDTPTVCEGFQWIGQSFATCDRCGQPAWEHAGEDVAVEGAGPFDTRRTVRPWKPGEADAIRTKWGTPAVGAQQPKEA